MWIDPNRKLVLVLMRQQAPPFGPEVNGVENVFLKAAINRFGAR
jgi:hypothetical protein